MSVADIAPAAVLFAERDGRAGRRIGIATLNAADTLNGLSLSMAQLLYAKLQQWADDDAIACVVLRGAGDKAFCAGGDLHGLYHGMLAQRAQHATQIRVDSHAAAFFAQEYRLDHYIHSYRKPILCWGHGIVMGGGIGLMAGASHRVVTARSRIAFPETAIGLFPDVGGSWLLRRVADAAGLFLALTGAPLNASDAIHAGLADVQLDHDQYHGIIEALAEHVWSGQAEHDRADLRQLLEGMAQPLQPGPLQTHAGLITAIGQASSLQQAIALINAIDAEDAWLQGARRALAAAAPGSLRLAWELQRHPQTQTLAGAFRLEYVVALHAAAHGDFAEGINKPMPAGHRTFSQHRGRQRNIHCAICSHAAGVARRTVVRPVVVGLGRAGACWPADGSLSIKE
jgi:enoyl-CoA hydratase/carnithine racemase